MSHTYSECPNCHTLNKVTNDKALSKEAVCGKCKTSLNLHGLVSDVSTNAFHKILQNASGPVVVDFWASWCGPCRMYGPEYEKASVQNQNTIFLKINTETEQQLSAQLGIRGIPCTILFKDGKEIRRQAGAMNSDQVRQFISG
ncbi:MAG: thioredoxin [Bacteriovoracaceae bacterium]